jgi:lysozyme
MSMTIDIAETLPCLFMMYTNDVEQRGSVWQSRWALKLASLALLASILPCCACLRGRHAKFPQVNQSAPGIFLDTDFTLPAAKAIDIREVPQTGINLTKKSEGFRGHLYNDAAHYCTIAYGHLVKKAHCDGSEPDDFRKGLTEPVGANLLTADMSVVRRAVSALVNVDLTDGQYGALCDFVYNVGAKNFSKSTLLKVVNDEDEDRIPAQFRRWVLANGKQFSALKLRREREVKLFFEGRPFPKGLPPEGEPVSLIDIRKGE